MPKVTYYVLEKRTITQSIATAALWYCALCGGCIAGMGGPGRGELCEACGDAISQEKFTQGAVSADMAERVTRIMASQSWADEPFSEHDRNLIAMAVQTALDIAKP